MSLTTWIGAILGLNAAWMTAQRLAARNRATGRVVDHEVTTAMTSVESSTEPTTLYRPIIEFADGQGLRHRFTAVGGDVQKRPRRGARVEVRFSSRDPSSAFVASLSQTWVMPIVWAVLSVALLWLGR